jgi:hypothetical protein
VAVDLGLLILVTLTFGAAGRATDMPAGTVIAAVAALGYAAFLIGPADHRARRGAAYAAGAFVILLVLAALIVVLAPAIPPHTST